ncbi:hypothetical protein GUJ93_ZPchr0006g44476 [Zizania palustris]|uniref:VTT domain-containing protein n=1 Tax=Zizania palustris TaxID=103762 RepID=A0A8J5SRW7_ZIZPA|nr:hypothetical protein GUJ93_ZPchr0006g44476 [Zizania palustris]
MSLLAGALFGQIGGVALVVFAATAGASSCYLLSKLIGKPLVFLLWPDKLGFFQKQVAKRREKLLNYMLFLRVTPTLPNTFINLASPIVDVPYHIFFLATFIGLIPAAYVTVRAGIALGDLSSLSDLYDTQSIALLFLIGVVSVTPTLLGKNEMQHGTSSSEVAASASMALFGSMQLVAARRAAEHGLGSPPPMVNTLSQFGCPHGAMAPRNATSELEVAIRDLVVTRP